MLNELLIWVKLLLLTTCLMKVSTGLFVPVDNYLIDCGSYVNTSVSNRLFVSDDDGDAYVSTSHTVFVETKSSSLSPSPSLAYDKDLYATARVFSETSQFTFSIKKHGRHWIRLYLFPFVSGSYNLSSAIFSVSAQNLTLLRDYQQYNGSVVKEYSLNVTSDQLVLTFTPSSNSFAFINAIEVVSVPDELIPDHARVLASSGHYLNLHNQALETVARVNMGNVNVSSENDTLWRNWVSEAQYLTHDNLVTFKYNVSAVNYLAAGSPSEDVAPRSVYGTATMLNSEGDPTIIANVTWLFDVDPGFEYLVRFHFCDIVRYLPGTDLYFNVYMNSLVVHNNLNLGNMTSNAVGVPYYIDAIVRIQSNSRMLNVSVGPSKINNPYPMAILNGLEIMKINSSAGSFYVSVSSTKGTVFSVAIIAAVIGGVALVALVVSVLSVLVYRRRKNLAHVGNSQTEEGKDVNGDVLISHTKIGYLYSFNLIQEATDNFNEGLVIGVGGFGKVYKGVLKDGTYIAVKRGVPQSKEGLEEFRTEIEMLSQFRHRHLVSLIGYCDERGEMIIIYEYMKNGSLKDRLYDSTHPSLSWRERLEICIGSARGLHYLHTGTAKSIIHRDVKSANILLDENLMAKVADFGLSKVGPDVDQTHVSTMVKGSFGYLDPEYLTRQKLTKKSDVYSFGVVLFEVICGRPVIDPSLPREMVNLGEWALKWQRKGELAHIIDPRLVGDIKAESLKKFGETAEKCLAMCGVDRPSMGDVLWNLEYALQLQGDETRPSQRSGPSRPNNGENSSFVISTQSSMGSVGEELDPDLVSMSQVFDDLVKQK